MDDSEQLRDLRQALEAAKADVKLLRARLKAVQSELDELTAKPPEPVQDGVYIRGRRHSIVHGPIAAKWILDEVKKGLLEEDRQVVALGD